MIKRSLNLNAGETIFVVRYLLHLLQLHRPATINTYSLHTMLHTCFFRAPHPDLHPPLPDFYYLPRSLWLVWLFDKLCTIYYQSSAVLLDPRSAIWLHHTLHHILSRQDPTIITDDKCWPSSSIFQSPRLHFHLIKHSWILDSDYHSW